ncbi:hypothetical protein [Sphingomonas crusticola]|uniref:hypothetical protein n=1 Tax=Sphingomonas crusticola TaxID=1697973 RepID=UPI000E2362EC|nr:hypothetical protein [Sphingomonas crusticola]
MPDRRPQRINLLAIGQSHVAAIRAAAKTHRETYPDEPRTRVIHTLEAVHAPEFEGVTNDNYGGARLGPRLAAAIEDQIVRHRPRVASVIGGNAHNMLTLMRHPRPFDFHLSGYDQRPPLDPDAEIVPEALVRAALAAKMQPDFARLRLLGELAGSFIHIESPPPLRDEEFIAARAEAWFRDQSPGTITVAPPGLRWRAWRLASRLMRTAVEAAGARFMPVPLQVQDQDGFLKPEYAADPTHGNEAYGAALIRALEDF